MEGIIGDGDQNRYTILPHRELYEGFKAVRGIITDTNTTNSNLRT